MAPKFPTMSKAEVLGLVEEVRKSLTSITAAELASLEKAEGSSSSSESSMSKGSVSPSERSKSPEASSATSAGIYKGSVSPSERSQSPEATPPFRKSGVEPSERAKDPKGGGHAAGSTDSPERSGALGKADPPMDEGSASSVSGSPSASEGSASAGGPPVDAPPAGPEGSAPPADMGAPPAGPEGMPPAGPEGIPPAGPEGMPPAGPEGAAPAGPSMQELVSLYSALPPEDFEAHVAAIQQAMQMKQGAAPGPEAGAPPPGPSAAPSPSPGAPPAFKSEKLEEVEAKLAKTQAELDAVAKAFEDMLTIPQRKAHTGIQYIPYPEVKKSEPGAKKEFRSLTKAELHKALVEMTGAESKLTKNERNLINGYFSNTVKLEALEPLYIKS